MNIVKNIFCPATVFLLIFITTSATAQKQVYSQADLPEINSIAATLPITFSWINFDETAEEIPTAAKKKIQRIIVDFYLESSGGDTENVSKAKDYYFNTLYAPLDKVMLFIVILKTPLSYSHCKLFLYDTATNIVSKTTIDYNTWAMYSIDDNSMKRSDLYKDMQLNSDDIVLKKRSNLLLRRLKHNGTYNELEEKTYHPNGVSLDSVSFKSTILH